MRIFLFFLLFCQTAFAALSPIQQSIREWKELLSSEELGHLPSGEMIEEILRKDDGFEIKTTNYLIDVELEYQDTDILGPIPFNLRFKDLP
mgnify:CR=1 FL=1